MDRRKYLQVINLFAFGLLPGCMTSRQSGTSPTDCSTGFEAIASDRWPMAGRDSANTGYTPVSTSSIADESKRVAPNGEGSPSHLIVREQDLYVPVFKPEAETGMLHAMDLTSASERWQIELPNPISQPAVADGRLVFVTSNTSERVGSVVVVDPESGQQQWTFDLGGRSETAPKIVDGTVFVARTARGSDGRLFALDVETGDLRWTFEGEKIFASPAIAGGKVLLPEKSENFVALNAETGEHLWSIPEDDDGLWGTSEVETTTNCSPATENGLVVVGERTGFRGVNACNGEKVWRVDTTDLPGGEYSVSVSPAIGDGTVYAIANSTGGDLNAWVLAVDVETGERQWKTSIDYGVKYPEPIVTDDAIIVPTWHKELRRTYVLDREDGSVRRELDLGGDALAVDSHLFVSNSDGVFAFEL